MAGDLITIVLIGLLVVLLDRGVLIRLPNRGAERLDRGLLAWVDLWIPLLLSLVWTCVVAFSGDLPYQTHSCWFAVVPPVLVTTLFLAMVHLCGGCRLNQSSAGEIERKTTCQHPSLSERHVWMLMGLGLLLYFVSIVGRLASWHGQVLVTAAVIWVWMSSPDLAADSTSQSAPKDKIRTRDRVSISFLFVVGIVALLFVMVLTRFSLPSGFPVLVIATTVIAFGAVFYLVGRRLGAECVVRLSVSTMIFSILFGLGGMALRLLPVDLWFFPSALSSESAPTHLFGLSSIRIASVMIMGIGWYALFSMWGLLSERSKTIGVMFLIASFVVLLSGSAVFLDFITELLGTIRVWFESVGHSFEVG